MTDRLIGFKFGLYSCALFICFGIGGFCLAALQVSSWIWLLNGLLILYLAKVGQAGIVLANVWVVSLLVVLSVIRPWPNISLADVPLDPARIWSSSLLLLWLLAETLIFLMAFTSQFLNEQRWGDRWRIGFLAGIAWLSMGIGNSLFHWKAF